MTEMRAEMALILRATSSLAMMQKAPAKSVKQLSEAALEQNARLLESVLADYGVKGEITRVRPGPVVTLYEFEPAAGVKSSRVIGLSDDVARSMSAISARISVISGRSALGIEPPAQ
jgi:DNA segregation ATPase FtsK/SpoIIIE, S-DNA-T family